MTTEPPTDQEPTAYTKAKQAFHRNVARGVRGVCLSLRLSLMVALRDADELLEAADYRHDWSPGGPRFSVAEDKLPQEIGTDPLYPYGDKVRKIQDLISEAQALNRELENIASETSRVQRPGHPSSPDRPFALNEEGVTVASSRTPITPDDLAERGAKPGA